MSSSTNNTTSGEPGKTSGQYHSVKGTAVEAIGNVTGATSWQKSGQEEHAAGEAETKAAQAKGYVEGTTDRIAGKGSNILGAVTGDKEQQAEGTAREQKGQVQQDVNKS